MYRFSKKYPAILLAGLLLLLGCVFASSFGTNIEFAMAQTKDAPAKDDAKTAPEIPITPPPQDINDLSMEVAALRTLYLLKAGPDQHEGGVDPFGGIRMYIKDCAQKVRVRSAKVSDNYVRVLTDLRAAFIVNNEGRIAELSEQLEDLTNNEQPELEDAIETTPRARGMAPIILRGYIDSRQLACYVAAYGKDFPNPRGLLLKYTRDTDGTWPKEELWKEISAFVAKEVSLGIAGVNEKIRAETEERVAALLKKAYKMTKEEMKEQFSTGQSAFRKEINEICNSVGPTDIVKHVVERDIAELLSNPRLPSAMKAREDYYNLKKKDKAGNKANP